MNGLHDHPDDATPLTPEEREGLIPSHIALRAELNELEQENILAAMDWAFRRRRPLTSEAFARRLHARMFGKVWRWAGEYRTTDKNLGVTRWQIQPRLYETLEQTRYWIEQKTFPPDEIAVRFHHGLVFIHPFANGNGRWSRLMADLLAAQLSRPRFSWGGSALQAPDKVRRNYIDAPRAADSHDFEPLLVFARS